ncbi:MAG: SagB family peptide dehydrogenase [Vicinamibacterales bacterium]
MPVDRYRRVPGLVIYWAGSQAVCFTWRSAERIPITFDAASLLDQLSDWTSIAQLTDRLGAGDSATAVAETVGLLLAIALIERDADRAGEGWAPWLPEAAFFHFATKNGVFPENLLERDRGLVEKATHDPPPPTTKHVTGPRLRLASADLNSHDLASTLAARRTWRRFSEQPVPAAKLATVLDMTFGVQRRGEVQGQGPVILRTSPSGGSRHPIEAYLLAWNVDGLAPGAYHYDSDSRELVDLRRTIAAGDIAVLLAHQTYFAQAAAVVIMCPVFARTMWRYPQSRAYRTVLIDAGHLGQTFCLVATALGLAPFTTMAFSESGLEECLGLDGVSESPVYIAGVGMPDPGAAESAGRFDVRGT